MRKYYPGITIFKLIGCVLVVLTHTIMPRFFLNYRQITNFPLLNEVIPCFFMASGFLVYQSWSNAQNADKYVAKYLKRILVLYFLFVLLFTLTNLVGLASKGRVAEYFTFLNLRMLFLTIILWGPYIQLWFIPPLVFGVAVSYYLINKKSITTVVIVGLVGFIITLFASGSLHHFIKNIWKGDFYGFVPMREIAKLYLGKGLTYVLTGVIIAKYEYKFFKINLPALIALCVCLSFAEFFLLQNETAAFVRDSLSFSVLPISILLFYGVLNMKTYWIKPYHHIINIFTIVIFFSQSVLIFINLWIIHLAFSGKSTSILICVTVLTFLEAAVITYLITRFKNARSQVVIGES